MIYKSKLHQLERKKEFNYYFYDFIQLFQIGIEKVLCDTIQNSNKTHLDVSIFAILYRNPLLKIKAINFL